MRTRNCFGALSMILTLSLCVGQLYAQGERKDQAKPKKAEVKTDLGNPARLAQPTAAEIEKARQAMEKSAQLRHQKATAQSAQPKQKIAVMKTVRGSRESAGRLAPAELQKIQRAEQQKPALNEGK